MSLLKLLRIEQWYKNLIVFLPMLLTTINYDNIILSSVAFIVMCLTSSIVYIINDLKDINEDRLHPIKKKRPLASGMISTRFAKIVMASLLIIISFSLQYNKKILIICCSYIILNYIYNYKTKHLYIADIITIAVGFILRGVLGAWIINVYMSPWLIICPFFVAMFLAIKKREKEYNVLGIKRNNHRKILKFYTKDKIKSLKTIIGTCVILSMTIYLFDKHPNYIMVIPLITYFVLREM